MSKIQPTNLELSSPNQLKIEWSDGQQQLFEVTKLREACPCATCREQRSAPPPPANELPILSSAEAQPLTLTSMRPVGNYAYQISFSDGHDTGIYTLERLRDLGQAQS